MTGVDKVTVNDNSLIFIQKWGTAFVTVPFIVKQFQSNKTLKQTFFNTKIMIMIISGTQTISITGVNTTNSSSLNGNFRAQKLFRLADNSWL